MKDNKALKYLTLITGVLTLLLGVYTLVRPMRTFLAIGWILGILLFVNGIELVILSLSKEKKEIGACILGVLEGLAGIILLFSGIQRFITDVMAAYMVGAIILIYGIFQIAAGTKVYKTSKGKGYPEYCVRCFIRNCQHHFIYPSCTYHDLCRIYDCFFCFDAGYQYDRTWNQFRKDRKLTKRL